MAASEFQGMRVIPGNEWTLDEVAKDEIGTIIKYDQVEDSNKYVNITVAWDSGKETFHKYPTGDVLKIVNTDILGVLHEKRCIACNMEVVGILWMCAQKECGKKDINLCSFCYHGDKHLTDHKFYRIDMKEKRSWVIRPERKKSQKISLHGICNGATVIRRDKGKSTQDAEGTNTSQRTDTRTGLRIRRNPPINPDEGRVVGFAFRNKSWIAQVKWNRQSQLDSSCLAEELVMSKTFQREHPLECTKPKTWLSVYRDHLPEPKDLDLGEYGYAGSDISGGSRTSVYVSGESLTSETTGSFTEEIGFTELYLETDTPRTSAKNARVIKAFGPNEHIRFRVSVEEMIYNVVDQGKPNLLYGEYHGGAMDFPRDCVELEEGGQIHVSSGDSPLPPTSQCIPSVPPPLPGRDTNITGLRSEITTSQKDKIPTDEPSAHVEPQMGQVARVLYKFTATEEGILNVEKSDMIFDISHSQDGWLNGWLNGKRGNIPEEMVEIEEMDYEQMQKMMAVSESKNKEEFTIARMKYGFENLCQGDVILEVKPEPEDNKWMCGLLRGQDVKFPARLAKIEVVTKEEYENLKSDQMNAGSEFTIARVKYGFEEKFIEGDIIFNVKPKPGNDKNWMCGLLRDQNVEFPASIVKIENLTRDEYQKLKSYQTKQGAGAEQRYVNSGNKPPILMPRKKAETKLKAGNIIFEAGDKVTIKNISDDEIREKQLGYGGWYDFMDEIRGKEGVIVEEMKPPGKEFTIGKMNYDFGEILRQGDIILDVKLKPGDNKNWMCGSLRGQNVQFPASLAKIENFTREEYEHLKSDQMKVKAVNRPTLGVKPTRANQQPVIHRNRDGKTDTGGQVFEKHDMVMIKDISVEEIHEKQLHHGGIYDFMNEIRRMEGVVVEVLPCKDVIVDFGNNRRPKLNPAILTSVDQEMDDEKWKNIQALRKELLILRDRFPWLKGSAISQKGLEAIVDNSERRSKSDLKKMLVNVLTPAVSKYLVGVTEGPSIRLCSGVLGAGSRIYKLDAMGSCIEAAAVSVMGNLSTEPSTTYAVTVGHMLEAGDSCELTGTERAENERARGTCMAAKAPSATNQKKIIHRVSSLLSDIALVKMNEDVRFSNRRQHGANQPTRFDVERDLDDIRVDRKVYIYNADCITTKCAKIKQMFYAGDLLNIILLESVSPERPLDIQPGDSGSLVVYQRQKSGMQVGFAYVIGDDSDRTNLAVVLPLWQSLCHLDKPSITDINFDDHELTIFVR